MKAKVKRKYKGKLINCDKASLSNTAFWEKSQETDGTIKNNCITASFYYTLWLCATIVRCVIASYMKHTEGSTE